MYADNYRRKNVRLYGLSELIGSVDWTSVSDLGGFRLFSSFGEARRVQIASSSDLDSRTGSGARSILVCGVDADFRVVTELIRLRGQTPVRGSVDFYRVFSAEIMEAGVQVENQGTVYVVQFRPSNSWTNGVPDDLTYAWLSLHAGTGIGTSGSFTIPRETGYAAKRLIVTSLRADVRVGIWVQRPEDDEENALKCPYLHQAGAGVPLFVDAPEPLGLTLAVGTDVYLRAKKISAEGEDASVAALLWLKRVSPA